MKLTHTEPEIDSCPFPHKDKQADAKVINVRFIGPSYEIAYVIPSWYHLPGTSVMGPDDTRGCAGGESIVFDFLCVSRTRGGGLIT